MLKKFIYTTALLSVVFSCSEEKKPQEPVVQEEAKYVSLPQSDTAVLADFTRTQVAFGPRTPGSQAHSKFREWVLTQFTQFGLQVSESADPVKLYTGKAITAHNITAAYRPEAKRRILLAAHYDSRMIADQDSVRKTEPIDGANDGASGVSVLLEVAKTLQQFPLPDSIGLDIVLFDAEDQGASGPDAQGMDATRTWCLGSQAWAQANIAKAPQYLFGILLDMVGGKGASFPKEGYSVNFAPQVVNEVWSIAQSLGYGNLFQDRQANGLIDDHIFVQSIAKIPIIDIIHYDETTGFHPTWHTHNDTESNLDYTIMQSVSTVINKTIRKIR